MCLALHLGLYEFIFVYGVRECSNFVLLHTAVQFSQHYRYSQCKAPWVDSMIFEELVFNIWRQVGQ